MTCQAKLKSGDNQGQYCTNKTKNDTSYCGRHANYKLTNIESGSAKKEKISIIDTRRKDDKWDYDEYVYMKDSIKRSRKRRIIDEIMNIKEPKEDKPKKKDKKKSTKSSQPSEEETYSVQEDEFFSDDSSDESSSEGYPGVRKNSIAALIKMGICAGAVIFEDIIDVEMDTMITGTMKELQKNSTAMEALEEIIEEYLPENMMGEEASPLLTFTALYLTTAAITHKNNVARAEILQNFSTSTTVNNNGEVQIHMDQPVYKEPEVKYNGIPNTQDDLPLESLFTF